MAAPVVGVLRWHVHVDWLAAEYSGIAHERIREDQGRLWVAAADVNPAVETRLPHAQ